MREQLRLQRDKNRDMEERLKKEEKNNIMHNDRMITLEQANRELKSKRAAGGHGVSSEDDFDLTHLNNDLQYKLQEA